MGQLFLTPRARLRRLLRPGAPSPLAGRLVLVTGASSGIGEATARAVARRGATVLLVARRETELERVRAAIEADGGRAAAYTCDVTDGDAVDALVARVLAEHGAVDYLVNNAGRSIRRSLALTQGRFHDFERTMAVNYFAPVRLTMGLLPAMRQQRFGHVVNVLSWGVQVKAPKFTAYLASKSALDTWSRIAGRETYADNVTFTNIRFGLVRTAMVVPDRQRGGPPVAVRGAGGGGRGPRPRGAAGDRGHRGRDGRRVGRPARPPAQRRAVPPPARPGAGLGRGARGVSGAWPRPR